MDEGSGLPSVSSYQFSKNTHSQSQSQDPNSPMMTPEKKRRTEWTQRLRMSEFKKPIENLMDMMSDEDEGPPEFTVSNTDKTHSIGSGLRRDSALSASAKKTNPRSFGKKKKR